MTAGAGAITRMKRKITTERKDLSGLRDNCLFRYAFTVREGTLRDDLADIAAIVSSVMLIAFKGVCSPIARPQNRKGCCGSI